MATLRAVGRAAGVRVIHATIRAYNVPGLAHDARIGFRDHGSEPYFILRDALRVGRVHRRFEL